MILCYSRKKMATTTMVVLEIRDINPTDIVFF